MQFKRNGTILDIAEPYNIKRIILDDEVFIYAPYNAAKKIRFSYFQVLNEGKFQLLKMHNVVYKGSAGSPDINNTRRFETLLPSYYLCYGNGTANLIDSKKKLIKILEPIPQEIIDYIRKNNTTINNENELIDIVRHTNRVIN